MNKNIKKCAECINHSVCQPETPMNRDNLKPETLGFILYKHKKHAINKEKLK